MCALLDFDEPASCEEDLASPKLVYQMATTRKQMSSMAKNHVWELDDLPPRHKTIGNKWVLKIKHKEDGSVNKYKACLVAKEYT